MCVCVHECMLIEKDRYCICISVCVYVQIHVRAHVCVFMCVDSVFVGVCDKDRESVSVGVGVC